MSNLVAVTVEERTVSVNVEQKTVDVTTNPREVSVSHITQIVTGDATSSFNGPNQTASTIKAGQAVAKHHSGSGCVLANATDHMAKCVALAKEDVLTTAVGPWQTEGTLRLTDWTDATGSPALATNGAYYLDTTDGMITTTPPNSTGNVVQFIGVAVSSDTLDLSISQPIKKA